MQYILSIAVGTVTMRPYVFAFLAIYLVAAVAHLGWQKTLYFTIAGYLIAFTFEYSSVNTGFPYGWYYYVESTKGKELWVAGVPFFDSLSYVFLCYCSYSTALLLMSPIKAWQWGLKSLETIAIRRSFAVLLLGSILQVYLDIIIDPVALQGERWFLGKIYGYRESGVHFGVPLSNYLGWWLVSILMVLSLQCIDAWVDRTKNREHVRSCSLFNTLLGPILYLSIVIFNITITCLIGEQLMAVTGILIFLLPIVMGGIMLVRRTNCYSREELAEHLQDYPNSVVAGHKGLRWKE